jgi:hypothetical protein
MTRRSGAVTCSPTGDGEARGVLGSPHYFVDGAGFFCPALHIDHLDGALVVQPDPAAFDEFVARCIDGGW